MDPRWDYEQRYAQQQPPPPSPQYPYRPFPPPQGPAYGPGPPSPSLPPPPYARIFSPMGSPMGTPMPVAYPRTKAPTPVEKNVLFPQGSKVPTAYGIKRGEMQQETYKDVNCCRQNCCCCIPRSRRGKKGCAAIVVLLLVGLGLLGYFFFPRIPDIKFENLALANLPPNELMQFKLPDATNSTFSASLMLTMTISLKSENYYAIYLKQLDVTAFVDTSLPTSSVKPTRQPIGKGTRTNVRFPSRSTTQFTLNFTLTYTSPTGIAGIIADPAFNQLLASCNIENFTNSPAGKPVKIDYTAAVSVVPLSTFNLRPKLEGSFDFGCPFSGPLLERIQAVLAGVKSGQVPIGDLTKALLTALQDQPLGALAGQALGRKKQS
ncbi:uncharacterized protein SPPG_03087 [Spizellomyces punctatus DAOM BR117]|uniref:Late embryogenesis abundant protein LEA-2 subgroup domain-containing protein n=1 Tax=Spizellomyces punctatus (strain DAOM BR117) TaxID=645134 RepID=A0A0L0HJI5_SPIPD|nr:uncharacterized protein SPPG_03087 [Spizellomyces punctatus DAOM BR117]KND01277.1 hypothetical protein SPPG_03087 [Spizellomyces punctatus DAOM BR117]|eukprot:XP_016609316.1 hypothetical protein SPPG_03087 [Spizellomyces punctatus DAOM BR117]